RRRSRADLLLALLRDDGLPRAPHDHRLRPPRLALPRCAPRPLRPDLLRAGRGGRPLLALRRHRVDLPLPAPLPDRTALMTTATRHRGPTIGVYLAVFTTLMVLTGLTVAAATVDMGRLNDVVMLGIAVTKATLVVLFFMHVRYGPRLVWVMAASGIAMLA